MMNRLFPVVMAMCLLFAWGGYAIGVAVMAAYDQQDPLGYLATPRLVIIALAAVASVFLLLRHRAPARPDMAPLGIGRRLAEAGIVLLAPLAALQVWALSFAPDPYQLAQFAGEPYALPISYGARVSEPAPGTQALDFRVCMPALTAFYDNPLCDSRGVTLTTQPLLDGALAQKVLVAAGAQGAGDSLLAPGQLEPVKGGLAFTDGTRQTVFVTDAVSGKVTAVMGCDSKAADLCHYAVPLPRNLVALVQLPPDSTDLPAAVAPFVEIASTWHCPQAAGCVNED